MATVPGTGGSGGAGKTAKMKWAQSRGNGKRQDTHIVGAKVNPVAIREDSSGEAELT